MFNLRHTISLTVLHLTDGCTEGFNNETYIHGYTAVSFMEGEGSPNL
jgi:hypothetical protein